MTLSRPLAFSLYDMTNGAISSGTVNVVFRGAINGNVIHPPETKEVVITSGTAIQTFAAPETGAFQYDLIINPATDALDYSPITTALLLVSFYAFPS